MPACSLATIRSNRGALNMVCPINWLAPLNRGLVAHWLCVPGLMGGSRLVNLARPGDKDGNHGTLTNGPTWGGALGRPGGWGSLNFSTTDNVVVGPTDYPAVSTNQLTVTSWLRPAVTSRGDIVNRWGNGGDGVSQFNLLYGLTSGKPQFFVCNPGSASSGVGSTAMSTGIWYHVAGTYDGSNIKAFLNGVEEASAASSGTLDTSSLTEYRLGNNGQLDGDLNAQLDDVRVYDRALAQAELMQLYHASRQSYLNELNWIQRPVAVDAAVRRWILRAA